MKRPPLVKGREVRSASAMLPFALDEAELWSAVQEGVRPVRALPSRIELEPVKARLRAQLAVTRTGRKQVDLSRCSAVPQDVIGVQAALASGR